jgi:chromosome segregation ATPase
MSGNHWNCGTIAAAIEDAWRRYTWPGQLTQLRPLKHHRNILHDDNKKLQEENRQLRLDLIELRSEILAICAHREDLQRDLQNASQDHHELNMEIYKLNLELSELKTKNKERHEQIGKYIYVVEVFVDENAKLRQTIVDLRRFTQELEDERTELRAAIRALPGMD